MTIVHGTYLSAVSILGGQQCPVVVGARRCSLPPGHAPLECQEVREGLSVPLGVVPAISSVAFHHESVGRSSVRSDITFGPAQDRAAADVLAAPASRDDSEPVPAAEAAAVFGLDLREPLAHPKVAEYAQGLRFEDPPPR